MVKYIFGQHSNIHSKDRMEDMIRDIGEYSFHETHVYDSLKDDSTTKCILVVQVSHVC